MTKICSRCKTPQNIELFTKSPKYKDGFFPWCRPCKADYSRIRRASGKKQIYHPEKARWHQVKHFYKLSQDDWNAIFESQGGVCAICKNPPDENKRQYSVDHDHNCCPGAKSCGKCVRGILCHRCNIGLGMLQEDVEIINSMLLYMKNFA
jgi:hypothetical protein